MALTIVDHVDDTNLLSVNWRKSTLNRIAKEYALQPGQCVVFENRAADKSRIVANVEGMPILLVPPIDPARQLSMHLEINEYLHAQRSQKAVKTRIEKRQADIKERLARRRARAAAARKRRDAERRRRKKK